MAEAKAWLYEHGDGRSEVHLFRLVGPPLGWTETPLVPAEALAERDALIAKMRGALTLAANRMDRMALEVIHENSARKYEWKEWAQAVRLAALKEKTDDAR